VQKDIPKELTKRANKTNPFHLLSRSMDIDEAISSHKFRNDEAAVKYYFLLANKGDSYA